MSRIRYGAGGIQYTEKTIEKEKEELEASLQQSRLAKAERVEKEKKKKKKKVIQEIMGDDLKESKEMLDEII
tara:strand:- start:76 stop:291 length:216 start_codon:yes stop_codon:yes gene_type:complete